MITTEQTPPKIDVRAASLAAASYFKDLYRDKKILSMSLEEVELSSDEKHWLITLSYVFSDDDDLTFFDTPRTKFKVFSIDTTTGKVVSMKIRQIE